MNIRKITTIKNYKSFSDFSWCKFCKNKNSQEEVFQEFSIIFGENGAGKSTICDILKSVSKNQDFQNLSPALTEIEIELNNGGINQACKYENGNWTSQVNKNSFLFFDVDFINANVHTHGVRSSNIQQGAHTQKAGQLIIDLDEKAMGMEEAFNTSKDKIESFKKLNADILKQLFTDKDKDFFKTYKDTDEKIKTENLSKTQEELKTLEVELSKLQKLYEKYADINNLQTIIQLVFSSPLSEKEIFMELFTRQIKEKAQDETEETIKAHFAKHRQFIEYAKDQIPSIYENENCPLCMQPLANATKVIEYYRTAFDKTYENAKKRFLDDIQIIKSELETIKTNLNLLPQKVIVVFDTLEKIKTNFEIQNIYELEEKTVCISKFNGITSKEIDDLIIALESLKNIERKQVDAAKLYEGVAAKVEDIKKQVKNVNDLIINKNKIINDFKGKYSEQSKITGEIQEKIQKQTVLNELIDFLKSDKITQIKNQRKTLEEQEKMNKALKEAQEDLGNYLANTIPGSVISQMIGIISQFNLNFTLEHIKPASNTRSYSFSFKIKDQKGNERDFKDGLSEGERQLISLAFFFAINENLQNKDKTVLILDDPVTSLDSSNLKILAELIHKKTQEFSQVIILTHHPLFFKYLSKCEKHNPHKFGILKNTEQFGGSFIFFEAGFDLFAEVKKCNEEINQNAQNGTLKLEEIALKYGQLLRLSVERFIKHYLLMWDKEKNFGDIISNLKHSKSIMAKISDDDLGIMATIYKYCNYSNLLHADKEIPTTLSELKVHIDKFMKIIENSKI